MNPDEFIESDMIAFLNAKIKEVKESEPARAEEVPLLYSGKDFQKDLDIAIASGDLNKAKSIFDLCKAEYLKASGDKKQEIFKVLNKLYSQIKEYLKTKKKESLEGEISSFEEEGVLPKKSEKNVFGELFASKRLLEEPISRKDAITAPVTEIAAKEEKGDKENKGISSIKIYNQIPSSAASDVMIELMKKLTESVEKRDSNAPVRVVQPVYNIIPPASRWAQESESEEKIPKDEAQHYKTTVAEELMEEKIKERINESCGIIRLALEKKDLNRAVVEYNKIKEMYSLIPSVLVAEKASIYNKILSAYKQIKALEQAKLMSRLSGPIEHKLTEEELVDKIASRIDRTQAFILNKDLQKAVEEYQEVSDLLDLLPDSLPEIKKRFVVDLARVYQGLQNLNHFLQNKSPKSLFENDPEKVLKKYSPDNPLDAMKKSMFKIEKYIQARALRSAMLEFNKIKSLADQLLPLREPEKKSLFAEVKELYSKIENLRKELQVENASEPPPMRVVDMKPANVEEERRHLELIKDIHSEMKSLYKRIQNDKEAEAHEKLLEIQHKIALLEDEKEQKQLLDVLDQLCHKTHVVQQERRLDTPKAEW